MAVSDSYSKSSTNGAAQFWGLFWLVIATLAALVFFREGISALLRAWQLPEYSHGPLIPVLSLLLFLRQLKEEPIHLDGVTDRGPGIALLLVAVLFGSIALDRRRVARAKRAHAAAEAELRDQPFDPFAGGYPVPPLPGQRLVEPRAARDGRAQTDTTTDASGSGAATAVVVSDKED